MNTRLYQRVRTWWDHPAVYLVLISLGLRLAFYFLSVSQLDPAKVGSWTQDAGKYLSAAEAIRQRLDFDTYGVIVFGPGFPVILAIFGFLISPDQHALVLLQIVAGAIGSVLLYYFALRLTGDRRIATGAGLLNALSLEAITLANATLSETFFFVVFLAALIYFWRGMATGRLMPYISAALFLVMASLIRSTAQFFFGVLLVVAAGYSLSEAGPKVKSLISRLWWPVAMSAAVVLLLGAWTARNDARFGMPYLALAQPGGMAQVTRLVQSDLEKRPYTEMRLRFDLEVAALKGDTVAARELKEYPARLPRRNFYELEAFDLPYVRAFSRHAREVFLTSLRREPAATVRVLLRNAWGNVNSDWGVHYDAFPNWKQSLRDITSWIDKKGLNYRVSLFSLIGLVMILRRKQYVLAVSLAGIFLYFAVLSGFSIWQGSRTFYPGQIAWAILIPYPLVTAYDFVRRRLSKAPAL